MKTLALVLLMLAGCTPASWSDKQVSDAIVACARQDMVARLSASFSMNVIECVPKAKPDKGTEQKV